MFGFLSKQQEFILGAFQLIYSNELQSMYLELLLSYIVIKETA